MQSSDDTRNFMAVHFQNVGLSRGPRKILDQIDWQVKPGEFAAILGPNGSGKSTLARIMLGYLWPTVGAVAIAGRVFGETDLHALREIVRLVQPNGQFDLDPTLSVREAVRSGLFGTLGAYRRATPEQLERVEGMIHRVGLNRAADNRYGELSTGERVRALVARALVNRPVLIILDEPTAGLDIRGREELLGVLDEISIEPDRPAVVMITHHVEELPRAITNILLLQEGKVAARGTPAEVLDSALLSRVYECPVELKQVDGRYYLHAKTAGWRVREAN